MDGVSQTFDIIVLLTCHGPCINDESLQNKRRQYSERWFCWSTVPLSERIDIDPFQKKIKSKFIKNKSQKNA